MAFEDLTIDRSIFDRVLLYLLLVSLLVTVTVPFKCCARRSMKHPDIVNMIPFNFRFLTCFATRKVRTLILRCFFPPWKGIFCENYGGLRRVFGFHPRKRFVRFCWKFNLLIGLNGSILLLKIFEKLVILKRNNLFYILQLYIKQFYIYIYVYQRIIRRSIIRWILYVINMRVSYVSHVVLPTILYST